MTGAFQSMFGTTSVLLTFWMQVKAEFPEIIQSYRKTPSCSMFYLCEEGFLQPSEMTKKTGELHTSVPLSHHAPDGTIPVAGKSEPRAPTDSALW